MDPVIKPNPRIFAKKVIRNFLIGSFIIFISLLGGMAGYHYLEKMSWIDAYVNAAMILSGMGQINPLQTEAGKIFAGSYALFSGIVFLVIIAIIFAPVIHRCFLKFHLQEQDKK